MANTKISIIGTGLIGTSLGLALKEAKVQGKISGHDKEFSRAKAAQSAGAIDKAVWNLPKACRDADLVILALPLAAIPDTMQAIADDLRPGTVVLDTAPLKVPVQQWAKQYLPEQVYYVGVHPILSTSADTEPSAFLFQNHTLAICPESTTKDGVVDLVHQLAKGIGGRPFYLSAVEHDGLIAATEQLPQVLGAALLSVNTGNDGWRDRQRLAGYSFEVHTALGGRADAVLAAWALNKQYLSLWLDRVVAEIGAWQQLLASEDQEALQEAVSEMDAARQAWLEHRDEGSWDENAQESVPKSAFSLQQLFLGDWGALRKRNEPK